MVLTECIHLSTPYRATSLLYMALNILVHDIKWNISVESMDVKYREVDKCVLCLVLVYS